MRLLYLQQLLVVPGTGGNDRCWQFARMWQEAGHEITFISSEAHIPPGHPWRPLPPVGQAKEVDGIQIYFLPVAYHHLMSFPRRILSFIRFFRKALKLGKTLPKPDAVLAYSAPLSVGKLGQKLAQHHRVPFFFEVADVWPDVPIGMGILPSWGPGKWLLRKSEKLYQDARLIFPFSEGMAQQITDHGVSEEKIVTTPNGSDTGRIGFPTRRGSNPISILYTGTIGVANDLSQLIRALYLIQDQRDIEIQCNIIGDGNDRDRVTSLAEELNVRSVRFHQAVSREESIRLLAEADIGVVSFAPFPVLEANAATKFFDYLAAGLPMVINYQGWQAQYLSEYNCGLSSPQGDVEAFAANLVKLARNGTLRQQMSHKGRRLAEKKFDRKMIAHRMIEAIEKASGMGESAR